MKMRDDNMLGWTPGQWAEVLKTFPPPEYTLRGLVKSRRQWVVTYPKGPTGINVTPAFLHAWDKVVNTARNKALGATSLV